MMWFKMGFTYEVNSNCVLVQTNAHPNNKVTKMVDIESCVTLGKIILVH